MKYLLSNWWFAHDVIKNMIMQIMFNLLRILIWPISSISTKFEVIWTKTKTGLWAKEVEQFSVMLYGKMERPPTWMAAAKKYRDPPKLCQAVTPASIGIST